MKLLRYFLGSLAAMAAGSLVGPNASATPAQELQPLSVRGDDVCGPRCVQYILGHYGQEVELTKLIREAQPERKRGASLKALQEALEVRGIHTTALRLGARTRLNWPEPLLVHVNSGGESGGHYVVVLPGSRSDLARIADGLSGIHERPWRDFGTELSGYALLTSREPITEPAKAVQANAVLSNEWLYAAGAACLSCLVLAGVGRTFFSKSARQNCASLCKGEVDHG